VTHDTKSRILLEKRITTINNLADSLCVELIQAKTAPLIVSLFYEKDLT